MKTKEKTLSYQIHKIHISFILKPKQTRTGCEHSLLDQGHFWKTHSYCRILNGERPNAFLPKVRKKARMSTLIVSIKYCTGWPIAKKKEMKAYRLERMK